MEINGYKVRGELKTNNSGFSKWGFAEKNGKLWFIKEFIDPVYPICTDVLDAEMIAHKKKICQDYEVRNNLLYRKINECSDGNLAHIEDFFRWESHYYLIMEKITAVSVNIVKKLPEEDKIRICKALIHSLEGLHRQGIVHADVKMDNVIFRTLNSGKITGKIIDFDNCVWEKQPPAPDEEIGGDQVYMAPETYVMMAEEEGRLDQKIDVFALGIVLHQIFTGEVPGFDRSKYDYAFEALLDGASLGYSKNGIPEDWRNLIMAMTRKDAKERISLSEAARFWRHSGDGFISTMGKGGNGQVHREMEGGSFFSAAGDL